MHLTIVSKSLDALIQKLKSLEHLDYFTQNITNRIPVNLSTTHILKTLDLPTWIHLEYRLEPWLTFKQFPLAACHTRCKTYQRKLHNDAKTKSLCNVYISKKKILSSTEINHQYFCLLNCSRKAQEIYFLRWANCLRNRVKKLTMQV